MNMKDEFYLVLPSNVPLPAGSEKKNTPNDYRTYLPQPFEVSNPDDYEVALSSIGYPQNFADALSTKQASFRYYRRKPSKGLLVYMNWRQTILDLTPMRDRTPEQLSETVSLDITFKAYIKETKVRASKKIERKIGDTFEDAPAAVEWLNEIRPNGLGLFFIDNTTGKIGIKLRLHEVVEFDDLEFALALGFASSRVTGKRARASKPLSKTKGRVITKLSDVDETRVCSEDVTDEEKACVTDEDKLTNNAVVSEPPPDPKQENRFLLRMERYKPLYKKYMEYVMHGKYDSNMSNVKPRVILAPTDPSVRNNCYNLFVYSNLVRETLVGNVTVPIMRVIPINRENDGKYVGKSFEQLRFRPLASNFIEYIDIKISDDMGNNIFFKYGKVITILHIRRRQRFRYI